MKAAGLIYTSKETREHRAWLPPPGILPSARSSTVSGTSRSRTYTVSDRDVGYFFETQGRAARKHKEEDGQQHMLSEALAGATPPSSCRLVEFEQAFVTSIEPGGRLLIVRGIAPSSRMEIFLSHRLYAETPDWWGIEVVGALPGGICLTEARNFEAAIPLENIQGRKGIEVIGAHGKTRIELQPAVTC